MEGTEHTYDTGPGMSEHGPQRGLASRLSPPGDIGRHSNTHKQKLNTMNLRALVQTFECRRSLSENNYGASPKLS